MPISQLAQNYPLSGIRQMRALAANYPGCIDLCSGDPSFNTPSHICAAACSAINNGDTHYTPAGGTKQFCLAVARWAQNFYRVPVGEQNVCPCLGATQGILLALGALVNPGDEVLLPDPGYTCYEGQVKLMGAIPVRVPLSAQNNFLPDTQAWSKYITPKTRAIIINYPHNPSGSILTQTAADRLADFVYRHGLYVICDEVYSQFVYDSLPYLHLLRYNNIKEQTVLVCSLSKTFAMTGWRVGFILAASRLIQQFVKLQEGMASCLPGFVLNAATAALNGPQECIAKMRLAYQQRRDLLADTLSGIKGLKVLIPSGGLCLLADISGFGIPSFDFACQLLRSGVLTCGGSAFGTGGEGYLRICFAADQNTVQSGAQKIKAFVTTLQRRIP